MKGGDWTELAFDALYSEIYARRDEAEAEQVIAWLEKNLRATSLPVMSGKTWVDLACGAGRHMRALARRGARVVGIDRSKPLLDLAAKARGAGEELVRGDLRALPFRNQSFAGGVSMFTSLGYFEDDEENQAVLAEAARVIEPGGSLVVDYLNAEVVSRNLVSQSSRVFGGYRVEEERRLEAGGRRLIKEVMVFHHPSGAPVKQYRESVAFWKPQELEDRVERAGFRMRVRAGDYEGRPFMGGESPRLILLAERRR